MRPYLKKLVLLAVLLLVLFVVFNNRVEAPPSGVPTLSVGTTTLSLLVADTDAERQKGLGGLAALPPNQGMLFVFDEPDLYRIWMKDMNFPIDIAWLDEDFRIVDIKENATPESYPEVFTPKAKSLYIVELNAGFLQKNNIKVGDFFKK